MRRWTRGGRASMSPIRQRTPSMSSTVRRSVICIRFLASPGSRARSSRRPTAGCSRRIGARTRSAYSRPVTVRSRKSRSASDRTASRMMASGGFSSRPTSAAPVLLGHSPVSIVDVDAEALVADVPVPGRTRWAIFDPIDRLFYVNIADPPCIVAVDVAPPRVVRTFPSPVSGPHGLDLDVSRRRLLCACDGGQLLAMSVDSGEVVKTVDLSGVPDVVFLNVNLQHVYVAVGEPGVIDVIDAGNCQRMATVKTEPGAHTIGFDAARNTAFAFRPQSHSAAVYKAGRARI